VGSGVGTGELLVAAGVDVAAAPPLPPQPATTSAMSGTATTLASTVIAE
jgi:hypothetical protein